MMQALDEAEATRRLALEAWQQKVGNVIARVEALAPGAPGAAEELAAAEAEWAHMVTEPAFELRRLRPVKLKGIGRVRVWVLRRGT